MWDFLSNRKVRLALLVNGLYLASLVMPSVHRGGARQYRYVGLPTVTTARPPVYVSLPPSTGPSKAATYLDKLRGDRIIYLEDDVVLSGSRGRRLVLSPTSTVRNGDGSPESVLLRFVSYSDKPLFTGGARFMISADGERVWPAYTDDGEPVWKGWNEAPVPPHVAPAGTGGVEENVGKSIPYEVFADVIRAKRVVLNLGPHLVELNAEHLEALRDMHRAMSRPPSDKFYGGRY